MCGRNKGKQPFATAGFRCFELVDEQQTEIRQFICLPDIFLESWVSCSSTFRTDAKAPILEEPPNKDDRKAP